MAITKMSNSGIASTGSEKYNDMLAGNAPYIPTSFESIASATGTGSSNTITFSSIPATYSSLQIRSYHSPTASSPELWLRINGVATTGNYSRHNMTSNGNNATPPTDPFTQGVASSTSAYIRLQGYTNSSTISNVCIIDIDDYTNTNKYKTLRAVSGTMHNGGGGREMTFTTAAFYSFSAITSISLITETNSFSTSTVVGLYGIVG